MPRRRFSLRPSEATFVIVRLFVRGDLRTPLIVTVNLESVRAANERSAWQMCNASRTMLGTSEFSRTKQKKKIRGIRKSRARANFFHNTLCYYVVINILASADVWFWPSFLFSSLSLSLFGRNCFIKSILSQVPRDVSHAAHHAGMRERRKEVRCD